MRKTGFGLTALATCLAFLVPTIPAHAQATRTWVSGTGDDANPCARTSPCKTFAGAISKTAPGGEIDCLDPGGFGALTITKAITIDCSGTFGSVLVSGTNGITIAASPGDTVVLRGLDFSGIGTGLSGISFTTGARLYVELCRIRNFNAGSNSFGIQFAPSGASSLFVSDTVITANGGGASSGGISIRPTGAGSARAELNNVRVEGNSNGIVADGTGTTGSSVVHVKSSIIAGSVSTGLLVNTGSSMAVMLDQTVVANNPNGVSAAGPKSAVFMSSSTVFGSNVGLANSGGGIILSYKTNNINGGNSPTDGAPTGTLGQN